MAITIRFQGGTRAGESVVFDDAKQRISLGRDAARCDVVFPADETQVGREHCALVRELGRYRLSLNQDNLVLVNGQPAVDEQELPPTADVQMGPNGPRLVVETMHDQSLPSTAFQGKRPGQPTLIRSAGQTAKAGRQVAVLAVLLLIVAGTIGYFGWKKHDVDVKAAGKAATEAGQTATEAGQTATAAEKKASEAQTTIASITPQIQSLTRLTDEQKKVLANVTSEMASMEKKLKEVEPRLDTEVQKASPSVYLVLLRDAEGQDYPQATAWVADKSKGIMATNGHVAELFPRAGGSSKLIVSSTGKNPKTFVVESVNTHPGYMEFQRLWAGYDPTARRSPISAESIHSAGPACDVALLQLENNEGLAESLPIAPQEVLDAMGPTYPVGYVGYPMEGLAIGGVNPKSPTPTRHLAYISSVTDYFGDANVDSASRLLVQHALPATGGASGSPIINRDGQVVAVLNAGNVIGLTPRARIGSSANIAFAQRADLVRELLDGSAIHKQPPRLAQWRRDIAKNFKPRDVVEVEVKGVRDRIANNTITEWKDTQSGSGDYTVKFETLVDRVLDAKPAAKTEVKLATAGPCFLMAYDVSGENPVFATVVEKDKDKQYTVNSLPTNFRWARFAAFDGHAGGVMAISVASEADAAKIALRAFHAARTRVEPKARLDKLLEVWKKHIPTLPGQSVTTEIASESSGKLPEPLSSGQPAVSKNELTLKEAGDYYLFVSTPGDDKIAVVAARREGLRLVQLVSDQRGAPSAFGSFKVPAGSEMVIFVLGMQKDVPYDLKLYRAVVK